MRRDGRRENDRADGDDRDDAPLESHTVARGRRQTSARFLDARRRLPADELAQQTMREVRAACGLVTAEG